MTLKAIDHVQLAIPPGGEAAARAFYGAVLGLAEQAKPAEMAKRGGCWFARGTLKVHLGVEDPFHAARKAHVAFRVDDVADLAERARAAGFEVVDDRALPGHERAFIFDPFGNRLEFLKSSPLAGEDHSPRSGSDEGFSTPSPRGGHGHGEAGATPHPSAAPTPSPAGGEG
jgi:catechol 2,3-dioxygenase-like lactoylglutathione lyase family enzyme